jgi:hypothetical protein
MQLTTLPHSTLELILAALQTAAMSPHHPWCRVARSGPKMRCDCHVAASSRAVEALTSACSLNPADRPAVDSPSGAKPWLSFPAADVSGHD